MKVYSGKIRSLKPNQIFVFGSNTEGRHGRGSARVAYCLFGAIYGQAEGLQGQSYAIITKDLTVSKDKQLRSRTPKQIKEQIKKLYVFAEENKDKEFLIPYTANSENLNGYSAEEMSNMFSSFNIPENIIFESSFADLIYNKKLF